MAIKISGDGSITGISTGGLPDGTVDTDTIAANAVTEPKLGADQASGLVKAWGLFAGSDGSINASFNVSLVTRVSTGLYTVTLDTPMSSSSYVIVANPVHAAVANAQITALPSTSQFTIAINNLSTNLDPSYVTFVVLGNQ